MYSFDQEGNLSFGISDYTDFEGMRYDPEIGIFGMDVCVVDPEAREEDHPAPHHEEEAPEGAPDDQGRSGQFHEREIQRGCGRVTKPKKSVRQDRRLHALRKEAWHESGGTACTCAGSASVKSRRRSGSRSTREVRRCRTTH